MWRRTRRAGGTTGTVVVGISDALFLRLCDKARAVRTIAGVSAGGRAAKSVSSMPASRNPVECFYLYQHFFFKIHVFPGVSAADNACNSGATSRPLRRSFSVLLRPSFVDSRDSREDDDRPEISSYLNLDCALPGNW